VRGLVADGTYDRRRTVLRINGAASVDHRADLDLLSEQGIGRVMLAKTERALDLAPLAVHDVVALLETPLGIENAAEIARAGSVVAVMWGADDLIAGLGGTASRRADGSHRDVVRYARSRALVAAKAFGVAAVDNVFMDLGDPTGLRAEAEDAVAVGFDAKVAIHPDQVPVIRTAFTPTPERVAWARRLLAAVGDERGVTTFEGRMVDGPIYAQAERIVRLATATGPE
jgi:citrate lyase subunit beta/citryl-CoA lyase